MQVPLSRTSCQLLRHVVELSAALDRARLKPLAEEVAEHNRHEKVVRREQVVHEKQRLKEERRAEQAAQKELHALMEALIKQVSSRQIASDCFGLLLIASDCFAGF